MECIELLIVVAIIGILATFAILQYQNHVIRSQITSAVAELNGAKPQYELIMNGASSSDTDAYTVDNMFFSLHSEYCTYKVHAPVDLVSKPALECELKKASSSIIGESIFLNRDAEGTWSCSITSGISDKFKPINCL